MQTCEPCKRSSRRKLSAVGLDDDGLGLPSKDRPRCSAKTRAAPHANTPSARTNATAASTVEPSTGARTDEVNNQLREVREKKGAREEVAVAAFRHTSMSVSCPMPLIAFNWHITVVPTVGADVTHPVTLIGQDCLDPNSLPFNDAAQVLGCNRQTLSNLLYGRSVFRRSLGCALKRCSARPPASGWNDK